MNSRELGQVLRCSAYAVKCSGRGPSIQQRTFSSSTTRQRYGAVPAFTEVSSPKLQDLLTQIRERLFLPAHVSPRQRDLIFKEKHKKSLEAEPVVAVIADEEFTLKHLSLTKDIPQRDKVLRQVLALMKEKKDWDNLPNLLGGLMHTNFIYPESTLRKIVQAAGVAGRQDTILECLRRVEFTGMTLVNHQFAVQVFFWLLQKAVAADWRVEETKKAFAWAEIVRDLMDEPRNKAPAHIYKHELRYEESHGVFGLAKYQPEVAGILLQLAAMRAKQGGADAEGKVEKYANDLLTAPLKFKPVTRGPYETPDSIHMPGHWLSIHVPVLHGMKGALTLLDPKSEVGRGIKAKHDELEQLLLLVKNHLADATTTREKPLQGLLLYEKLLGSKST
ncbi:hypothetical protein PZA11_006399 [Diplocarpon coronariae]|uniref:Uncharacterized protein n=1 Tax=Diplocarpon coronariae TaxID=2795749 RepID=A0A218Z115_9HELO|nr:hypothetical protein JHW43_002072 [Diplocarpon mali]OWP01761.1 hypothetical protein B2J93_3423 [Marssonina coronariae]